MLTCVGVGETDVKISWSFEGEPVVNSSQVVVYEEDSTPEGRRSILQICSLTESDSGDYTCVVSDGITTANSSTELTVTG